MGKQEKRVLTLDRYEHGVVVNALNEMRNDLLEEERPTDIVDEVLLKVIDAPRRRGLRSLVSPASERKLDHSVAPPLPKKLTLFGDPEFLQTINFLQIVGILDRFFKFAVIVHISRNAGIHSLRVACDDFRI